MSLLCSRHRVCQNKCKIKSQIRLQIIQTLNGTIRQSQIECWGYPDWWKATQATTNSSVLHWGFFMLSMSIYNQLIPGFVTGAKLAGGNSSKQEWVETCMLSANWHQSCRGRPFELCMHQQRLHLCLLAGFLYSQEGTICRLFLSGLACQGNLLYV